MTRAWAWEHARGMRKALEAGAGLGRAWVGLATARGGRRGGASPARAQGLLGCAIGYTSRSKRKSGWGRSSPRLETSVGVVQGVRRRRPAVSRGGVR